MGRGMPLGRHACLDLIDLMRAVAFIDVCLLLMYTVSRHARVSVADVRASFVNADDVMSPVRCYVWPDLCEVTLFRRHRV